MSLDVYLVCENILSTGKRHSIFVRKDGQMREISRDEWDRLYPEREPITVETDDSDEVYHGNITSNLSFMARESGIYQPLWQPDALGIIHAEQLISYLTDGLAKLKSEPELFKKFNPPNGWGTYEVLVQFVDDYLIACKSYPSATVVISK